MDLEQFLHNMEIPYRNIDIFKEAFTHPSYANENKLKNHDYERLEFVGDAVLQCHISRHLFDLYPDLPEGRLTKLRAKLVREESLARFARELNLGSLIFLGAGEINNGGRDRDSVLADIFEALIGAICHDCGPEYVEKMLEITIYKHVEDVNYDEITDFKTRLQELIQADQRKTVTYDLISATGPSNNPVFEMAVKMDEMILGVGVGSSKKKKKKKAAKDALNKLAK